MCLGMSLSVRPFSDSRFSSCSLRPYSLAGELAWLHVRNGRSALIWLIMTTCAANHGPSLVVFSLGGLEMLSPLSPSCRVAERPLNTYRFVYRLDHLSGMISAILTYIIELYKVFRNLYLCYTSVYSNCNCFYAKLGTLNHISFVLN